MNALPHGIADPLHINEPFPLWMVLAAGLLLWLLYRLFRLVQRRRAEPPPSVVAPPPIPAGASGIATVIEAIRRRYRKRKAHRHGCHKLAAALRKHFDRDLERKASLATLTAAEMTRLIGDTPVARLFGVLSELQFYRRPPTRGDFEGACDLALEVAESRSRFGKDGS